MPMGNILLFQKKVAELEVIHITGDRNNSQSLSFKTNNNY